MNQNIYLKCPIRGELKIKKYDAKGNYSEEYWRIELIKFLLDKGYQKGEIKVEYTIKIGNPERDRLIADVCVFKGNSVHIVGEVKKHKDSKSNAVEHQLKPAMNLTKAEYGIYFDGSENELHYQGNIYPINKLPKKGHSWEQIGLKFNDLRKITEVSLLYDRLDQIMHNYGLSKEKRYAGLFQVLIMKYYDEKFNKEDLVFQIFPNSKENFSRIKSLYQSAKSYYSAGTSIDFENELILNETIIINLVSYLQEYSFIKSDISIIQDFFMRFGKEFLKKDLSQYYTPLPIVKFISSILAIKPSQLVIDPAGGSADFLVGVLEKYKHSPQISDYNNNLFYWDISPDAHKVAHINMILHGDGRGKMSILDSIEEYEKMNGEFDFVITNPPFGDKTIWQKDKKLLEKNGEKVYSLSTHSYQLGILFIERGINLLKEGGILVIILPSGYLNNQSLKYIREYLFKYRIIADISLPEGVFKGAETGVKTEILVLKKTEPPSDYRIFASSPKKLGFNYRSKKLEPIYKVDETTGEYLQSSENVNIPDDELNEIVIKKFKKFCCEQKLEGFEQCKNSESETYDYVNLAEIKNDEYYKIKPELFLNSFREHMNKLADKKAITLRELFQKDKEISVENKRSIEVKEFVEYWYIDIGNSLRGDYSLENLKKGWQIKKIDRARQSIKKYDICLSYLLGSRDKFFMMLEDETSNIVVTNGFYRVRISNERIRLSFFAFLFSKSFEIQFEAFATGHIQTNIVPERVWDFRFPLLSEEESEKWKNHLVQVEKVKKETRLLTKNNNF